MQLFFAEHYDVNLGCTYIYILHISVACSWNWL